MVFEVLSLVLDPRRIQPTALQPSYFLIDGSDWMKHIVQTSFTTGVIDRGEASQLITIVKTQVGNLQSLGIQPVVFLGQSPVTTRIFSTRKGNQNKTLTEVERIEVMRRALQQLSVDIEDCQEVSRAPQMTTFANSLTSTYPCYIYGSASIDLWAVSKIKFILFNTLQVNSAGDTVEAPLWDRTIVAQMLFVSEKQLSELLILLGNAYTGVYSRKVYKNGNAKLPKALWTKLPRGVESHDDELAAAGGGEGNEFILYSLTLTHTR